MVAVVEGAEEGEEEEGGRKGVGGRDWETRWVGAAAVGSASASARACARAREWWPLAGVKESGVLCGVDERGGEDLAWSRKAGWIWEGGPWPCQWALSSWSSVMVALSVPSTSSRMERSLPGFGFVGDLTLTVEVD